MNPQHPATLAALHGHVYQLPIHEPLEHVVHAAQRAAVRRSRERAWRLLVGALVVLAGLALLGVAVGGGQ